MRRAALLLVLGACVREGVGEEGSIGDLGTATFAESVDEAAQMGCSTAAARPLAQQLVDEIDCMQPGVLVRIPDEPQLTLASAVFPFIQRPAVPLLLRVLAERPGVGLGVNSMLRTLPQQYMLHRWYQNGQCGISLAAAPGTSNHETGTALDINDNAAWRAAFEAHGFRWLGASDPVHFDYVGPGAMDLRGASVLAFQRLWNRNHPEDPIAEDGDYGPMTEARVAASPSQGFPTGAVCSAPAPDAALAPDAPAARDGAPRADARGADAGRPDAGRAHDAALDAALRADAGAPRDGAPRGDAAPAQKVAPASGCAAAPVGSAR